jgi:hypothetical protein
MPLAAAWKIGQDGQDGQDGQTEAGRASPAHPAHLEILSPKPAPLQLRYPMVPLKCAPSVPQPTPCTQSV